MARTRYFKGPKLLSIARQKALKMGVASQGVNLEDLIRSVQDKEGHTACFRKKKRCPQMLCCWQASCGAKMSPQARE